MANVSAEKLVSETPQPFTVKEAWQAVDGKGADK